MCANCACNWPAPWVVSASMRPMRAGWPSGRCTLRSTCSSASCSCSVPWPRANISGLPQCGQCRGTAWLALQWWQRSRRSPLWKDLVGTAMGAVAFPAAIAAPQHRRKAPAVEQHQALLAALNALGNGLQQGRGKHGGLGLLAHIHQVHAGQGGRSDAAGHVQPLVAALLAGVPALQRGGGAAQNHFGPGIAPAPQGQVAGGVPRPFFLFEAGVVLFIDDDDFQLRQAGQHRHARAQHDAGLPGVRGQPVLQALRLGQAAVQAGHGLGAQGAGKAPLKPRQQLGGEVDLGHQHQGLGLRVGGQGGSDGVQIHLGLAAAGAAVQQKRARILLNLADNALLLCGKCY